MAQGVRDAMAWRYGSDKNPAKPLARRLLRTSASVRGALRRAEKRQAAGERLSESELWILDNCRLLRSANREAHEAVKSFRKLPSVFSPQNESVLTPRAYMVALGFLKAVDFQYHQQDLALYLEGIQQVESLQVKELWALKPALQLGMLEQIAADAEEGAENGNRPTQKSAGAESRASGRVRNVISSLRALGEDNWKEFFEDHSATERVLREDPSGTYPLMDYDSRDLYRRAVEEFASQSLFSEEEVARTAVLLARRAKAHAKRHDSRMSARRADLGYYLIAEGSRLLKRRLGCRPPLMAKLRQMILDWPEIYYIVGVELTTIGLVFVLLRSLGIAIPLIPGLLLLIPASHAAVGLVNRLTTFLIPPRRLPKLDFSEGVPPD
ncbi:MAG: hypothetical protein LAP13_22595, partial [Acidobacteriia bacterium]|nr:hypothetical protein [Terriglobia bacterium]